MFRQDNDDNAQKEQMNESSSPPAAPEPKAPKTASKGRAAKYIARSLWPSKYIVNNAPSGIKYVFLGAGSEVEVVDEDVEFMRGKSKRTEGCCGGSSNIERHYFEVVEASTEE